MAAYAFLLAATSNAAGVIIVDAMKKPFKLLFRDRGSPSSALQNLEYYSSNLSKSYAYAFEKIMDALGKDEVNTIGVWGKRGVGKTTLVTDVVNTAKTLQLFNKIIKVVLSQTGDVEKIQDQISDLLELKFQNQTKEGKADELLLGLEKEEKVLIILEDVTDQQINLTEIGISFEGNRGKGCKIILTTHRKTVCESMASQVTVTLDVLKKDEAWNLFKTKASLDEEKDDTGIIKVAKKVAKKCKGLPVAILTLASALKGIDKTIEEWKVALEKLRSSRLMEIGNIEEEEEEEEKNAYMCIKMSYDYLKKDTTKRCFLLCGLYPEDHSIDIEELVAHAWGLKLFDNATSIKEMRVDVKAAITDLKNSGLLLDDGERYIKMHKMVRSVALWTASNEDNGLRTISGIWPENEISKQNLKILLLDKFDSTKTPVNYFEGMQELKVLSMKASELDDCVFSLNALTSLKNLRALQLEGFKQLEGISALGELTELEILRLHCSILQEPIHKLGELKNLKVLDMCIDP